MARILVLGGTRFMGVSTVSRLVRVGHEVAVFNRGSVRPPEEDKVKVIVGDRNDPASVAKINEFNYEVIVDFSGYTENQMRHVLDAIRADVHYIYISSGSVYAPRHVFPWPETNPYGPWQLWGDYAHGKMACELALKHLADRGSRVTIFRLPFVLGPKNYAPREEFIFNRILDQADILIPGDGRALQHFVSADQVAESVELALNRNFGTSYEIFNIADPYQLVSLIGFVELCAEIVGVKASVRFVSGYAIPHDVFNPYNCIFPFPNENYVLAVEKASQAGILPKHVDITDVLKASYDALINDRGRRQWQRTQAEKQVMGL
jgi:2'-hydroxyisoflavone reductase